MTKKEFTQRARNSTIDVRINNQKGLPTPTNNAPGISLSTYWQFKFGS